MDINKLNNNINGRINKTEESSKGQKTTDASSEKSAVDSNVDNVSINDYKFLKNDREFAKLEMEKVNDASSKRLLEFKSKISEYQEAKNISDEAARETEIGRKINDSAVWEDIAKKILQ